MHKRQVQQARALRDPVPKTLSLSILEENIGVVADVFQCFEKI